MSPRSAARVYRASLRLLPRRLRTEFGDDAVDLFVWQISRAGSVAARIRYLIGAVTDVLRQAVAGRAARRPAGNPPPPRRSRMDPLLHDLRIAIRSLLQRPGFTIPVVVTLGLGIGLAAAMVTVVRGVLLEPLPYPDAERLVVLRERMEGGALLPASIVNFGDWREASSSFEALAAVAGPRAATVLGADEPLRVPTMFVTSDFFRVGSVEPFLGRTLRPEENRPGGPAAVVVSHGFWSRALSSRLDLESVRLTVQDLLGQVTTYTVVGVMPPGFALMDEADVYVPLDRAIPWNVRGNHVVRVVGRLAPGASPETARLEVDAIQARIHDRFSGETEAVGVGATSLRDDVIGPVRTPVVLLLAGALLLLASAFLDAAGALLARGVSRQQELLVRASLGATRGRLLMQLVLESGLYALAGLLAGLFVARALLGVLTRLAPPAIPRLAELRPEGLGLAVAASLLAALGMLLFGVATAWITTRGGGAALRVRGGGTSRGARAVWNGLIAAEVALALMLLTTAGVLGRSLWGIATAETGFSSGGVLTAEVSRAANDGAEPFVTFFDRALDEIRALPGVESAGLSNLLPVPGSSNIGGPVELESGQQPDVIAQYRVADGGFFGTLGITLLRGRVFDATDAPGAPHAAVINTTMAERIWPGEDAVGKRFHLGGMDPYRDDWLTVVGIVEEARPWSVEAGTYPVYYVSYRQRPLFLTLTGADLVVRGADAAALADGIRSRITALDANVPIRLRTLDERLASRTADRRFVLSLLGVFAVLSLVLTALGIWGVVTFIVSRRTRDMGIRMALGARPAQVLRGLQREALPAVVLGMIVGGALAVALTRLVRSQLYGVGVFDPLSLGVVAITMAVTAWCASYVPARRVKRLDPAVTLRDP